MTTTHRIILDRDGDPTAEVECEWNFYYGEPGSLAICSGWQLDRITARDADSGQAVELDESEIALIKRDPPNESDKKARAFFEDVRKLWSQ